jgi:O-antigen/teichoic acid export membrane protein
MSQSVSLSLPSAPAKGATSPTAARTRLLLEGPILPTLLRLSAPNVLNLLAFAGMILFDGFFLGRISTSALAGASLAFPWVMLIMQTTNSGMGVGVASAVSRALGAGRRDRANDLVFHAFLLALALAAIFSTAMLAGTPFLFRWMGGRDEMLSDALAYANVALGGAVCICMLNLLGNTVRGTGNMSLPATVMLGCVLAHIALAPVLIFGLGPVPALGPAGAAWGLVLPFGVGSVVMIGYLRSSRAIVGLSFRGVIPRWELFSDILKVGVPGLNTSCNRWRSDSAPRSSPWSARTGVRASIAGRARSHGLAPPSLRCFAARSGQRSPSARRYGSDCSATMKASPGSAPFTSTSSGLRTSCSGWVSRCSTSTKVWAVASRR